MSSDESSSTADFTIAVSDVNEFPVGAVIDSAQDTDNALPENALASSYTGITLSATDGDASAIVTYTLTDSANGLFLADTNTGVITLQGSLDYERSTRHTITAQAKSDDGSSSTADFTIAVSDVNEFPVGAVIDSDLDTDNALPENAAENAYTGITLSATDGDASAIVTYTLTDSANGLFLADTNTGVITLQGSLDYESAIQHTITAQAISSDDSDPTTAAFTIAVIDVNEFDLTTVTDSDQGTDNELPENAAANAYTGITLSATDADGSAVVTYELTDSSDGPFLADTNTGMVTLQGQLDYERSTRHTIIAQAISSDGSDPTTQTFTIAVTDVNEHPVGPVSDSDPDTDNALSENAAEGAYTGITLNATDGDRSAVLTYALTDSNDDLFAVDPDSGRVTLLGSLDYERSTRHTIIAQAISSDGSDPTTAAFTIAVANINEITLRDRNNDNNVVAASTGSVVLGMTLEAIHADGAPITAWGLSQDADVFELTQAAGSSTQGLRIKADAENLSSYAAISLSVIARTELDAATEVFTIRFTEQEPVIVGELRDADATDNEVAENSPNSSTVGITIQANNATAYTLTESADGRFAISSTGLVTVADGSLLNFEDTATHSIIVEASSINDRRRMSFAIAVTDVNEFDLTAVADSDAADNVLPEDAAEDSYTGITLRATDADGSAIITYTLTDSNEGLFLADTNTGTVTLRGSLDYERSTQHTITARAISSDGSAPTTQTFTIAVTDANEFGLTEVIDSDAADNELPEDALANAYTGITLSATDEDGTAMVTYALTDSNDDLFAVDNDSGRVTLLGSLDYKRSTQHTIIAQAISSDGSDPTTAAFTIAVTDVSEFDLTQVADSDPADNALPEDAAASSYTGITLSATDGDASAIVTYALTDSNDDLFAVDVDSGRVTLRGSLDYERSTRHTIIAQAISSDGSAPTTAAFTIAVTDVNEHPVGEVSDSDQDTGNALPENAAEDSYTGITLNAEDEDGTAIVTYALTDSNDDLFAVDGDSGRVTLLGSLDYERSTRHTIIAQAMSSDESRSTAAFTIAVIRCQ